ncbi:MAG: hypothetical protein K6G24_03135 [Lachnospiraceae bacterium]|nr:hypothetical protein [Lachnospiraceae bacterium]
MGAAYNTGGRLGITKAASKIKRRFKECEEARQDSFRRILAFLEGWN